MHTEIIRLSKHDHAISYFYKLQCFRKRNRKLNYLKPYYIFTY